MGPGDLEQALKGLQLTQDPNLIAGIEGADDAGVYRISDELALIQTVDFFTPIVDDPYVFGQIAVANALSDVYAMGGQPLTALNIVTFPAGQLDISILRETLRGGLDQMHRAGVLLVGGHSVDDPEMKYGLAVTGTIHPDRVIRNTGVQPGDRLVMTKPLGTGVIATATKRGAASAAAIEAATASMVRLNDRAAAVMQRVSVHAATDITGFGLLGHATEMLGKSELCFKIESAALPLLPEALALAQAGYLAGGVGRNRDYYGAGVTIEAAVPPPLQEMLYDPQSSGGLLIAVAPEKTDTLLAEMQAAGVDEAVIIGEAVSACPGHIRIT